MLTNNGGNDTVAAVSAMGYDAYFVALEALKLAGTTDSVAVNAAIWNVTYLGVSGADHLRGTRRCHPQRCLHQGRQHRDRRLGFRHRAERANNAGMSPSHVESDVHRNRLSARADLPSPMCVTVF